MLAGSALSPNPGKITPRNVATAPHSVHDAQNGLVFSMSVLLLTLGASIIDRIEDSVRQRFQRLWFQRDYNIVAKPARRSSSSNQIVALGRHFVLAASASNCC